MQCFVYNVPLYCAGLDALAGLVPAVRHRLLAAPQNVPRGGVRVHCKTSAYKASNNKESAYKAKYGIFAKSPYYLVLYMQSHSLKSRATRS